MIGNGPGDPDGDPSLKGTIETLRRLLDGPVRQRGLPLAGVCLGHQVTGLAIGGQTSRLKFGHRGGNHPVKDLATGRVYITSQNHELPGRRRSIPRRQRLLRLPRQPERRLGRGPAPPRAAGLHRAVPPGGRARGRRTISTSSTAFVDALSGGAAVG